MTVAFMTSHHLPEDDRIFYHQAVTLAEAGHTPVIISSKKEMTGQKNDIIFRSFNGESLSLRKKADRFQTLLDETASQQIICQEPFTVLLAARYRRKASCPVRVIFDITEWHPSKKDMGRYSFPARLVFFPIYLLLSLRAGILCNAFIFGEWYKSKPFRRLFPRKKYMYLTYYPDLKYIPVTKPVVTGDILHLSYSGKLSREKGFRRFLRVVKELNKRRPGMVMDIKVIGWFAGNREKQEFEKIISVFPENIRLTSYPYQNFSTYLDLIRDTDIFLDLRDDDFENNRCLPIRIFYYAALGRPVIYTDLKAIRKEVEIEKFGFLVKPDDVSGITDIIIKYLDNKELYLTHCARARTLAEEKYNWENIKSDFLAFLNQTEEV